MSEVDDFLNGLNLKELEYAERRSQALFSKCNIDKFLKQFSREELEDIALRVSSSAGQATPAPAPPSRFDKFQGSWYTQLETAEIVGNQIKWPSGRTGKLITPISNGFSMRHTDGKTYTATLGRGGKTLKFDDGDEWFRDAPPKTAKDAKPPAAKTAPSSAEPAPELGAQIVGTWYCEMGSEAVTIAGKQVKWLSGREGTMAAAGKDAAGNSKFSMMHTDGKTYTASLINGGQGLKFSDGDTWSRDARKKAPQPRTDSRSLSGAGATKAPQPPTASRSLSGAGATQVPDIGPIGTKVSVWSTTDGVWHQDGQVVDTALHDGADQVVVCYNNGSKKKMVPFAEVKGVLKVVTNGAASNVANGVANGTADGVANGAATASPSEKVAEASPNDDVEVKPEDDEEDEEAVQAAAAIVAKQAAWDSSLANLQKKFPNANQQDLAKVLKKTDGHANKATKILQSQGY